MKLGSRAKGLVSLGLALIFLVLLWPLVGAVMFGLLVLVGLSRLLLGLRHHEPLQRGDPRRLSGGRKTTASGNGQLFVSLGSNYRTLGLARSGCTLQSATGPDIRSGRTAKRQRCGLSREPKRIAKEVGEESRAVDETVGVPKQPSRTELDQSLQPGRAPRAPRPGNLGTPRTGRP